MFQKKNAFQRHRLDPVAPMYGGQSPYNSMFNDPVALSDPMGDDPLSGAIIGAGIGLFASGIYVAANAGNLESGQGSQIVLGATAAGALIGAGVGSSSMKERTRVLRAGLIVANSAGGGTQTTSNYYSKEINNALSNAFYNEAINSAYEFYERNRISHFFTTELKNTNYSIGSVDLFFHDLELKIGDGLFVNIDFVTIYGEISNDLTKIRTLDFFANAQGGAFGNLSKETILILGPIGHDEVELNTHASIKNKSVGSVKLGLCSPTSCQREHMRHIQNTLTKNLILKNLLNIKDKDMRKRALDRFKYDF